MDYEIIFSQFGDMFPRAAKEPALAIWQSCGVPGLKKLLRMNLLQRPGHEGQQVCGSEPAIYSAVQLILYCLETVESGAPPGTASKAYSSRSTEIK